jgi:hypothetical protein
MSKPTLPKMFSVVNVVFWSIRYQWINYGQHYEHEQVDELVARRARRVHSSDRRGWRWQLVSSIDDEADHDDEISINSGLDISIVSNAPLSYPEFMQASLLAPRETLLCSECGGSGIELLDCCSGFECGCRGIPVDAIKCTKCSAPYPSNLQLRLWLARHHEHEPHL